MVRERDNKHAGDWLPLALKKPLLTKSLNLHFIRHHKDHDWFLALASTMVDFKDSTQGRMLAKAYLFLHDHLPRGFVGDYGHIRGGDVMNHLLCHLNEHAVSRHKATKDADAAFSKLEAWMKHGDSWEEAFRYAREEAAKPGRTGKRKGGLAPALHSPAGIITLLVIAYPDPRFKDRIGRLGIDWMVKARDSLNVKTGFWKGINTSNLYDCFAPEAARATRSTQLANYDRLLGKHFLRARKDMRPYWPDWAARFMVEPTDIEGVSVGSDDDMSVSTSNGGSVDCGKDAAGGGEGVADGDESVVGVDDSLDEDDLSVEELVDATDGGESVVVAAEDPVLKQVPELWERLSPSVTGTTTTTELGGWLVRKMADGGEVIQRWVRYWAGRMDEAEHYEVQIIIRSLFLQSLRRLKSLSTSTLSMGEAYMLLDGGDGLPMAKTNGKEKADTAQTQAQRRLEFLAPYMAYTTANDQLSKLASSQSGMEAAVCLIKTSHKHQTILFQELFKDPTLNSFAFHVVLLERLRTEGLLEDARDRRSQAAKVENFQADLLEDEANLKLTRWQLRQLAVPGTDAASVLTDCQLRLYRRDRQTSNGLPITPIPFEDTTGTERIDVTGLTETDRRLLCQLFGELQSPPPSLEGDAHEVPAAAQKTPTAAAQKTPMSSTQVSPTTEFSPLNLKRKAPIPQLRNIYAGQKCTPAKRNAEGTPRAPKVTDLTCEDLKANIRAECEQISGALKASIRDTCAEQARASAAAMSGVSSDVQRVLTEIGSVRSSTDGQAHAFTSSFSDLGTKMERALTEITAELAAVKETMADMATVKQILRDLKGSLIKEPSLGEDGYLAVHCPAPDGWVPQAYETILIRAAWFYIHLLGAPDDGVSPDEDSMEETLARFPNALQEHVHTALQHVHKRFYRQPFAVPGSTKPKHAVNPEERRNKLFLNFSNTHRKRERGLIKKAHELYHVGDTQVSLVKLHRAQLSVYTTQPRNRGWTPSLQDMVEAGFPPIDLHAPESLGPLNEKMQASMPKTRRMPYSEKMASLRTAISELQKSPAFNLSSFKRATPKPFPSDPDGREPPALVPTAQNATGSGHLKRKSVARTPPPRKRAAISFPANDDVTEDDKSSSSSDARTHDEVLNISDISDGDGSGLEGGGGREATAVHGGQPLTFRHTAGPFFGCSNPGHSLDSV